MSNNNLKFFSGGTKIIFEIAISCSVHDGTHLLIFRCPSLHIWVYADVQIICSSICKHRYRQIYTHPHLMIYIRKYTFTKANLQNQNGQGKYRLWGRRKTQCKNKHNTQDNLREPLKCDHNITVFLKGITDAYKLAIDFLSPFTN